MAIDPRQLRPSELCRLLNSTPLGEVVSDRQLRRNRNRAGTRIHADGDAERIDLFRYVGWMAVQRHEGRERAGVGGYEEHRERMARKAREHSHAVRDIGEIPGVVDPERKEACRLNFRLFCESYFPETFSLAWSPDHLKVIAKIEASVIDGGLYAIAMPRGSGKTSLCERACIWAKLYRHREFIALIGASKDPHATNLLEALKSEYENNDRLLEDFPEVCFPIRALEGITQRAAGQLCQGKPTNIRWTSDSIVLPTIEGSLASGAAVRVAGITGGIRGMKHTKPDGRSVRPSLVMVDDPQTDESAWSPSQCEARERVLAGAILGLAGPGQKIAGLMPVTVVRPDDLADRMIDRERNPEWQGERTKMVYAWPEDTELWTKYAELRKDGLRHGRGIANATEFYRKHRRAMDEGAQIAWPERFNPDELSAVQHAMNLRLADEVAFFAEYQNEPKADHEGSELKASEIAAKVNWLPQRAVPLNATVLTAFVDVQATALYWAVVAWAQDFTGAIMDYGTHPEQPSHYFTLRDLRKTFNDIHPGVGREAQIYGAIEELVDQLMGAEWKNETGGVAKLDQIMIDANWGESTEVVKTYCRRSPYGSSVLPSHGRGIGASAMPMGDYRRAPGDRIGVNWRIPAVKERHGTRHVVYDTNYWKSFVHARLKLKHGESGAMTLFGRRPERHAMLSEHLTAEYRVRTEGRGRVVDEWKVRPNAENHFLDCVVGAAVAASVRGVALPEADSGAPRRKVAKGVRKMSLSERQAAKKKAMQR